MIYNVVTLKKLRECYEVSVSKIDGDATDWSATIHLASHSGVEAAAGCTIEVAVSARTGEAKYVCLPPWLGSRLPEFVPALHEALKEYAARQRQE